MRCDFPACGKDAVTFHGLAVTTHGYCEEHRCCHRCGRGIKRHEQACRCPDGPRERPEYLEYLRNKAPEIEPIQKILEDGRREQQYEDYKSRSQI